MYPWATKEYLLWNMTIGQIILYHNKGNEIKNGVNTSGGLLNKSVKELKEMAMEAKKYDEQEKIKQQKEAERNLLKQKYGAI